ncbi:PDGLE domain-containing protein [Mycobacterium sp. DL592]|uniref:PDGLE domain-containing protein n=1 Tax=Mycobacterium sp. DL592 TaxID=2675524 RepID=UPI001424094D|nr:PDGLE domain-containing protein [Mycobacterium sp. DL592]
MKRHWRFWAGFVAAIVLIAGVVSYFASSSPDGLDSATLQGCQVVETQHGEQLTGSCIAQHATEHPMSVSPLADYTLFGHAGSVGAAGIIGAVVVLALAGGLFWLLARSRRSGS